MIWSQDAFLSPKAAPLERIAKALPQCADRFDLVLKLARPGPEVLCRRLQKYSTAFVQAAPAFSELHKLDDTKGLRLEDLCLEPERYIKACREVNGAHEEMLKRNDAKELEIYAKKKATKERLETLAARLDCPSDRMDEWDSKLLHREITVH